MAYITAIEPVCQEEIHIRPTELSMHPQTDHPELADARRAIESQSAESPRATTQLLELARLPDDVHDERPRWRLGLPAWRTTQARPTPLAARAMLLSVWHRLPRDARAQAVRGIARELDAAMPPLAGTIDPRAATLFAADAATPNAVAALPAMLSTLAADKAEQALLVVAFKAAKSSLNSAETPMALAKAIEALDPASETSPCLERSQIEAAVFAACDSLGKHGRSNVLLAAALLADARGAPCPTGSGTAFVAWISAPDCRGRAAFLARLRNDPEPLFRRRAVENLTVPAVAAACQDRLKRAIDGSNFVAASNRWHLVHRPARLDALATRDGPLELPTPPAPVLDRMPDRERRGIARLAAVTRQPVAARGAISAMLIGDPSPAVRLAAILAAPIRQLSDFVFDTDASIATLAAASHIRHLNAHRPERDPELERLWALMSRSPHAAIRRLAADECGRLDPTKALRADARVLARQRLSAGDAGLLETIHARLGGADPEARREAVALVRRLALTGQFADELAGLIAREDEPRAAADAAAALAAACPERFEGTLAKLASAHPEPRVRSNIIDHAREELIADVLDCARSDASHRVRATAIRRLISGTRDPSLLVDICSMLRDSRPSHRRAAAWLATRVQQRVLSRAPSDAVHDLLACVEETAATDSDPVTARRARWARRLLDQPVPV
jgi:hypothetical protein